MRPFWKASRCFRNWPCRPSSWVFRRTKASRSASRPATCRRRSSSWLRSARGFLMLRSGSFEVMVSPTPVMLRGTVTVPSIGARTVTRRALTTASALVVSKARCKGVHPSATTAASATSVLMIRHAILRGVVAGGSAPMLSGFSASPGAAHSGRRCGRLALPGRSSKARASPTSRACSVATSTSPTVCGGASRPAHRQRCARLALRQALRPNGRNHTESHPCPPSPQCCYAVRWTGAD